MKIVTYHGPVELKSKYLEVREVYNPDQIMGLDIVGVYPDTDVRPAKASHLDLWEGIANRIFSRFPFMKR